jgi:hypothetical protein
MKMKKNILGVLAVAALVMVSCSKEKVELPESNDPVFTISGTMGDDPFELIAGDNNAYMHTNTEVVNGVNVYSGMISDGNVSVELGIYDGLLDMPGVDPEVEIGNVSPVFAHVGTQPLTILSKTMLMNAQNISSVEWFIDGVSQGTNDVEIVDPGHYDVCAAITFLDQTVDTLCNDLILGYSINGNFSINADCNGGYVMADLTNSTGTAINNIIWYLNGSQVGQGNFAQVPVNTGTQILTAEVHFANGAKRTKNALVNGWDQSKTVEDFTIFEGSPANYVVQDFNVRLLMNMDGASWSSELADNSESSIVIANLTYYGTNDAGNDVYKITAHIDAKVRSLTSLKEIPVSFTTDFGVEVP